MPKIYRHAALAAFFLLLAVPYGAPPAQAQTASDPEFEIENAVLDTSVLFVIGAQEAVQELRGSFGWPNYQEGLVDGIYFRFDPDGYARFGPNARLDSDMFEVVCRPRTVTCVARKGALSLTLNAQGQLQVSVDDVSEGDMFFLSDGASEIQLPDQILQTVDTRLEALLSTTGELVVRRGEDEFGRIPLAGFAPTVAYLRWVAAKQDYSILPRNWPIPGGVDPSAGRLTRTEGWTSPTPQPLAASAPAVTAAGTPSADPTMDALRREIDALRLQLAPPAAAPGQVMVADPLMEMDALRREVDALRGLIARPAPPAAIPDPVAVAQAANPAPAPQYRDPIAAGQTQAVSGPGGDGRAAELQALIAALTAEVAVQDGCGTARTAPCAPSSASSAVQPTSDQTATAPLALQDVALDPFAGDPAATDPRLADAPATTMDQTQLAHLNYLIDKIGLDAKTAVMVLELGLAARNPGSVRPGVDLAARLDAAFRTEMVSSALADLAPPADTPDQQPDPDPQEMTENTPQPEEPFQLLSDYLQTSAE